MRRPGVSIVKSNFRDRQTHLIAAAAAASEAQRTPAQLELARFYLARELTAEAKGVLDVAAGDERAKEDSTPLMLRAIANVILGRGADAMKDLASPAVAKRSDVTLWRALAQAQQGKWVEAREGFRSLETATATLPLELQRLAFQEAARAAVEVRDFGAAATLINEFDTLGPAPEGEAELAVLKGRVMEGLGRLADALTLYRGAAETSQRPAAARARLREIALRQMIGDMKREDATAALERLSMGWRGDETEAEALQLLGRLYAEDGRYRDAFQVMRTALTAYPRSEMTRRIQDEAAAAFDLLFLGGKGDSLPAIDALSLFYDFRDLTPVGRRGDEMIRKLADRLVAVDLLDQAAELLQHQVDNRLQGAARAQVAVRLAVIYLIARKPDRALAVLRTTRSADLPNELRNQRLLIEARAQSDVGRPDVALEVIANLNGPETERLRADIMWKARRWREASEQMEKMLRRSLARLHAAHRAGTRRRDARRDRLCARRGHDRARPLPHQIRAEDGRGAGPPRLRGGDRAVQHQCAGVRRHRARGRGDRYARGVPARHPRALPRDHRTGAGISRRAACGARRAVASAQRPAAAAPAEGANASLAIAACSCADSCARRIFAGSDSMRIVDIREVTAPIASSIANAYIDFSKMTLSLVAVVTDVKRDGRSVVGYGFNSNGRYGQGGLIRERFAPRLMEADPKALLNDAGDNLDPDRIWAALMRNEKPGGHGERSVAVGTIDMAVWDAVAKIAGKPLFRLLAERHGARPTRACSSTRRAATTIRARASSNCAPRCAAISTAATRW